MFGNKIKLLKTKFLKESEGNNKRKIENLLVFLVLLIITIIAINTIWGEENEGIKRENNNSYKQLALDNTTKGNKQETSEYNLEQSLEEILSKISGVGKVDVLITYSETSQVVAMYNEKYTSSSTEETDTNGGTRKIEETDTNKEIIFEEANGEKTPITQKVIMPKMEGAIVTAEGARKYQYKNKYNSGSICCNWIICLSYSSVSYGCLNKLKRRKNMKILKRNQLIVLVISLMLITAGYLNFTSNQENVLTSTISDRDDTTIGDAQLVSTIPSEDEVDKIENLLNGETNVNQTDNSNIQNETTTDNVDDIDEKTETIETNAEDYYFTTSKLDRNTMYSELLETYQEMYNNTNATAEQKSQALEKINEVNNTKNAIMIAENLIIAKGFEDAVIFVNDGSVSVVIEAEELKQEDVAKVQNIVSRELNVNAEKIHISNK